MNWQCWKAKDTIISAAQCKKLKVNSAATVPNRESKMDCNDIVLLAVHFRRDCLLEHGRQHCSGMLIYL